MISFDEKYGKIHAEIQENSELIKKLFKLVKKYDNDFYGYKITNFKHKQIFLGLMPGIIDKMQFSEIVAKMRIVYDEFGGKVNLSNVYALLHSGRSKKNEDDEALAVLSEDVSGAGRYRLIDEFREYKKLNSLRKIFYGKFDNILDIPRMVFQVRSKKNNRLLRTPILDFDHVKMTILERKYKEYCEQYKTDERFRIYLPINKTNKDEK